MGGQAVNKSIANQWWKMENDERGNKLAQRSWQGTYARRKHNTDTTAQSIGMTGGTIQPTRATVHCQAWCVRLDTLYAYLNALTIEGKKAKDAVATTDKERKEYLGKERLKGIHQQCPHCYAGDMKNTSWN